MNWIIFILILSSLLCRPNVRKETSNNGNLRKLKENFTIALGLSLLFGLGWAFGLLASSDLPGAVRYPAEWIFTLMTAFLGVYLFALYIVRSAEARRLWKRYLCQFIDKKKAVSGVSSTSTPNKRTVSSTVRSWGISLKANTLGRVRKDTSDNSSTSPHKPTFASANSYSGLSTAGQMANMTSPTSEQLSVFENTTAMVASPLLPPVEIELVRREDPDVDENSDEEAKPKLDSPSKVPIKKDIETETVVKTMSFHDNLSLLSHNAFSSQSDVSLSGTRGECYIVENKQIEGSDIILL